MSFIAASTALGSSRECFKLLNANNHAIKFDTSKKLMRRLDNLTWSNGFSDVKKGIASDYVYVVTAVRHSSLEKHLGDNYNLDHRSIIAASVIADIDGKRTTAGLTGFILKIHRSNVIGTYPEDTGWYLKPYDVSPEEVAYQVNKRYPPELIGYFNPYSRPQNTIYDRGPVDPVRLIEDTNKTYNEVLLLGTSLEGHKVEIVGVFQRVSGMPGRGDKPLTLPHHKKIFEDLATKLNVPFIDIPDYRN